MYSSESCVTDTPVGDPPTSISPPIINGETSTGVYSAISATNNNVIFRCPQGKVFQDSWKLYRDSSDEYARVEDEAYAVHNGSSWLDGSGASSDQWTIPDEYSSLQGLCTSESCEPLSIIDSDKEVNPLVGKVGDLAEDVICNEGYIFDHDQLHRRGRVKCDYLPKFPSEPLKTKNEVTWLVHNPHLEELCESKSSLGEQECIHTTDPLQSEEEIGCVWIPEYSDDEGFTKQGECRFLKRADENETNPICKPMYCNERSIPNSDRMPGRSGPLPGPSTEREHGSCIDFDGQIIDAITNSSDCNCYKHKSCDTCTDSPDCQWCGYSDTGEGGFCFSTKTDLQICNTHIRNDNTGTCSHVLQPDVAKEPPLSGDPERFNSEGEYLWNRSECETNTCANESNWSSGVEDTDTLLLNGSAVDRDSLSLDECMSLNNRWNAQGAHSYTDKCIFTNNGVTDTINQQSRVTYYPYTTNGDNSAVYLSTQENICVPREGLSLESNETCNAHTTKLDCENTNNNPTCRWIQNPLRDSLFHWTDNYLLKFTTDPTNASCPIPPNAEDEEGYSIIVDETDKTLQLSNVTGVTGTYESSECFINTSDIFGYDLFSDQVCSDHGGRSTDATSCRNGVAYCDSEQTISIVDSGGGTTNTPVCPSGDLVTIEGTDIQGCYYSPTSAGISEDNYCHSDLVTPRCSEFGDTEPFNCTKNHLMMSSSLAGSVNNSDRCLGTGYTSGDTVSVSDTFTTLFESNQDELKEYLVCDISGGNVESQCNYIGDDHAHYGTFCQSSDDPNQRYPVKHICKALGNEYTIEDGERVCLDRDTKESVDVCGELTDLEVESDSEITWTETQTSECIVDSEEFSLTELCESSENHQDGFQYVNSDSIGDYTGVCEALDESRQFEVNDIRTAFECEQNNKVYVQKYNYYNTGTCETLVDRLEDQPDIPTTWTGGEITMEEQGVHRSECSASLMSSCNVDCDDGYGGGGEYICHYNSDGAGICDEVNDMSFIDLDGVTKQQACERYPSCQWSSDTDTCSHRDGADNDGHMEWLGSECYQLNNDAFAHGIAPMPELDELLPPLYRIILFVLALIVIGLPFGYYGFRYVILLIGNLLEGMSNSVMSLIKKVIDFNFQSTDIPSLFTSKFSNVMSMDRGKLFLVVLIAPLVIGFGIIYAMNELNEYVSLGAEYISFGFTYAFRYIYSFLLTTRISTDGIEFGTGSATVTEPTGPNSDEGGGGGESDEGEDDTE